MSFEIKRLSSKDVSHAKELALLFQKDDGVKDPTFASDHHIKTQLSNRFINVIVALVESEVVGGAIAYELPMLKENKSEMYLFELGVTKSHRRKGIASQLIEAVKEICRKKKIEVMYLECWADNEPAKKLYKKTGGKGKDTVEFTYEIN